MHVQKETPAAYDGKTLGGGKVGVPASLSAALPAGAESVSSKVTAWTGMGPLFWAAGQVRYPLFSTRLE